MGETLTKETLMDYLSRRKVDLLVNEKCQEILQKVSMEITDVFKRGTYSVGINISKNNLTVNMMINGKILEPYNCDFDILYEESSLLINLRNIKDVLYEARKTVKEPPKSLFERLRDLF